MPGLLDPITDDLQGSRSGHLGGTLTGLAHPYMWGSGGMRGAPSIPYGSSPIGGAHNGPVMRGLVDRGVIPDQGLELPGFQGVHDPQRNGGTAPGLVLHAWSGDTLDKLYSLGCFTVPKSQWGGFKQDLLDYQKANGGNAFLNVTPTGEAKITSAPMYGANGVPSAPPPAQPGLLASAQPAAQPQPTAPSMALGGTNVPPPQASAPTPSTGSKPMPGLLDGYDFGKAFSNPLFQFGAGMAGAGGKGMGIGGGFAAGADAVREGQDQGIKQRAQAAGEQAKRTLLDPSNPAGLDGATRAIVSSMGPEQAAAWAANLAQSNTAVAQAMGIARGQQGIMRSNLDYIGNKFGPQAAAGAAASSGQPRQAPDGNYYVPDPNRPGKYLMVQP